MIKNYLKSGLRSLAKNKAFSLINILGLALGIACSLLIILWVQDEKSMDAFHIKKDRLYNIFERQYYDGRIEAGYYTPGLLGQEMKRKIPEIEFAVDYTTYQDLLTFQVDDKIQKEKGGYASADFFSMFSFPILLGKPSDALKDQVSISISRKMANHFFGSPG